ncbi:hypothetical protein GALMADRAFT_1121289 [Galerina marginata CBS 339.88]|uniref:Uncharacterized protein n=1 Tax=Galerina marginata (strain CBS 339.88) TaxID=685588 RepID=A0A067TD45_GALM3|nr:hypothetical protein GALMADRAFT_1121289 [Galerina marginata CBS 339.88]
MTPTTCFHEECRKDCIPPPLPNNALTPRSSSLSTFQASMFTLISAPTQGSPARHRPGHIAAGAHALRYLLDHHNCKHRRVLNRIYNRRRRRLSQFIQPSYLGLGTC